MNPDAGVRASMVIWWETVAQEATQPMTSHRLAHGLQVGQHLSPDRRGECPDGSVVMDSGNRTWQVRFGDRWSEAGGERECTLAELHRVAGPLVIAYLPKATDEAEIFEAGS
jgi:hypothetical protein